jgi:hypothetical protein
MNNTEDYAFINNGKVVWQRIPKSIVKELDKNVQPK